MGVAAGADPITTDALVIGAGPVGLFQVFQLGLLEMRCHVVDSLPAAGGQCVELYADKPIYDIPGLPLCSGLELSQRLQQQIAPFGAAFHLGQVVTSLHRQDDGRFALQTSAGTRFVSTAVVIAGGVGAFQPRRLKLDGLDLHEGRQLLHAVADATQFAGQQVLIVGNGDAALGLAVRLAEGGTAAAASVTLVHRRDSFDAAPALVARMRQQCAAGTLRFVAGQVTAGQQQQGRLTHAAVTGGDGGIALLTLDVMVVLLGLSPRLGPIADWGLALERRQLRVDTQQFQTSTPGIFAVGDINTYPGKKKLIVCGFHEATLAAFGIAARVFPGRALPLQYTTTSPRLHQLLGVVPGHGPGMPDAGT